MSYRSIEIEAWTKAGEKVLVLIPADDRCKCNCQECGKDIEVADCRSEGRFIFLELQGGKNVEHYHDLEGK